jgi:hypothetical protein
MSTPTNLFASAKSIAPAAKKGKKDTKQEIGINGLKQLAEMKAVIDNLTTVYGTLEGEVKAQAFALFVNMPKIENFRGIEDGASASVELRKRSTRSPLTPEEVALLAEYGITSEKNVITTEMFGVNPKYSSNIDLLGKVSSALNDIVPSDFFVKQNEVSTQIISEKTHEAALATKNADVIRIATVIALKPTVGEVTKSTIEDVLGYIG